MSISTWPLILSRSFSAWTPALKSRATKAQVLVALELIIRRSRDILDLQLGCVFEKVDFVNLHATDI